METPDYITDRGLDRVLSNGQRYKVYDSQDNLWIDVVSLMNNDIKSGWSRAYSKLLATYISVAVGKQSDVLAYLLVKRDGQNRIFKSHADIAKDVKCTRQLVGRVFKRLIELDMVRVKNKQHYMLTSKMIRNGDKSKGAMMLQLWGEYPHDKEEEKETEK